MDSRFFRIVDELHSLSIIQHPNPQIRLLSGGTSSKVAMLSMDGMASHIIKVNEPSLVQSEAKFLRHYTDISMLPKLIYVHPMGSYLVYEYQPGKVTQFRKNKREVLLSLVKNVVNQYTSYSGANGFGWLDEPCGSWRDFLTSMVDDAFVNVRGYLSDADYAFVRNLVERTPQRGQSDGFLIHGDCGVHNFLFHHGMLVGVIDPTPIIGWPIFDVVYAFCSSPEDLYLETVMPSVRAMTCGEDSAQAVWEEVMIGLFLRISTCIRHHPNDLSAYLDSWKRLRMNQ